MRAAAGLGQAAADHVADREERDVEPGLVREEDVAGTVGGVTDRERGEQNTDDGDEVDDELGRPEGRLRLGVDTVGRRVGGAVVQGMAGVLRDKTTP